MAHRAATSTTRLLVGHAVHIKTDPKTRNIHESQEILRLLKGFGELISFRNLRYDPSDPAPHTIVAIFQEAAAVSRVLSASPLRLTVQPRPPSPTVTTPIALNIPDLLDPGRRKREDDFLARNPARHFTLSVKEAVGDQVTPILHRQSYWGWGEAEAGDRSRGKEGSGERDGELVAEETARKPRPQSFAEEALGRVVPLEGLKTIGMDKEPVPARIVKRNLEVLQHRPTLWEVYEEGLRERETEEPRPGESDGDHVGRKENRGDFKVRMPKTLPSFSGGQGRRGG